MAWSVPFTPRCSRSKGPAYAQKGRLRATWRSQKRLWLSWTPMESASSTGRPERPSPDSYMACPASCTEPARPWNHSVGLYRVVMRTSAGLKLVVNGCTDTSHRPCANPSARTIRSLSSAWASLGKEPSRGPAESCGAAFTAAMRGWRAALVSAKSSSRRAAVMPGSNSPRQTSYSSASPPLVHSATARTMEKHSASTGWKDSQSLASRALAQAAYALLPSLALRSASSAGILVARS
mmetsp:Transcript_5762/g.19616  ORF Transcript_5762/g.19616 Transcript_5762/m.19616 type:complete len:237 (-) Transcript_5762:392-1102(-)